MNKNVLEYDYPELNITEETIKSILNRPQLFHDHIKTCMGKIYTNKEFEEKSRKVLKSKLS